MDCWSDSVGVIGKKEEWGREANDEIDEVKKWSTRMWS